MVKIILIRHAQSVSNTVYEGIRDELVPEVKGQFHTKDLYQNCDEETKAKIIARIKESKLNTDIANSWLTPKGISQCVELREELYKRFPNIKKVMISPMRRAILTFENLFEEYPSFKKGTLPITLIEEMREILGSASSMGCWTEDQLASLKYRHLYNFDFMKEYERPHFWFLYRLSKDLQIKAEQAFEGKTTHEEKVQALLEQVASTAPKAWEHNESCYKRVQIARHKIEVELMKNGYGDGELCIISHQNTLGWFVADMNVDPENGFEIIGERIKINNIEIIEYEFHGSTKTKKDQESKF